MPSVRWARNKVDRKREHIKLFYGNAEEKTWDEFDLVALLSPPAGNMFNVQFVLKKKGKENDEIIEAVQKELDYYLVDKQEKNPWAYAIHHCLTASNLYSNVHWAYFQNGDEGNVMKSEVIIEGGEKKSSSRSHKRKWGKTINYLRRDGHENSN